MAARNSCTHITWSEAKNKDSGNNTKKTKGPPKKQPHNQILAAKILAKNGFNANDDRKIQKAYRKQDEKAAAVSAKHEEERELKRLASLQEVRPYEQAKQKLSELALELQQSTLISTLNNSDHNDSVAIELDELMKIAECKETQINEIIALEAMIPDDFYVSTASNMSELQHKLDELSQGEPDDETLLRSIADHPPLSFLLKLEIDEISTDISNGEMELVALILLRVTPPPLYPSYSAPPRWDLEYVMVTDKQAMCSADKPLESLAFLDEKRLQQALLEKAEEEILPYPCVYELGVTFLSEQVFEFLKIHPHALAIS